MKKCSKCGADKSFDAFHVDRKAPDGFTARCKACRLGHDSVFGVSKDGCALSIALPEAAPGVLEQGPTLRPPLPLVAPPRALPATSVAVPRSLLIIPDVHIPWHHVRAVGALLDFAYDVRPGLAVQLGDAIDMYSVSRYPKDPKRMRQFGGTVFEEAQAAQGFWLNLLEACDEVHFIEGNHEDRFKRTILDANPGLVGHPALESRSIFALPEKLKLHPYGTKLRVGNITICHGDQLLTKAAAQGPNPAQKVLGKYHNQNTVFGHTHKIANHRQTVYNFDHPRTFAAWNIGWLGDYTQIDYETDPLWQLGFAYVEFWKDADERDRFTFHQIEMVDGRFSWGGKVYGR